MAGFNTKLFSLKAARASFQTGGGGIASDRPRVLEFTAAVIDMARRYLEREMPYFSREHVYVHFHFDSLQSGGSETSFLLRLEVAVLGPVDDRIFASVYSRFCALKKVGVDFMIHNTSDPYGGFLVEKHMAKDNVYNPTMSTIYEAKDLEAVGVATPELLMQEASKVLANNYNLAVATIEQRAFEMIKTRLAGTNHG